MSSLIRSRWAAIGAAVAVTLGAGGIGLVSATSPAGAATLVPIDPCRLADTRPAPDNVGPRNTPIGENETLTIVAEGDNGECTGIPAEATGLALNVTAIGATNPVGTFLTIWGDGDRPNASHLNPVPGQPPTPNAVDTGLTAAGELNVYNRFGTVDVIVDVLGYYSDHHHDDRYYTEAESDARYLPLDQRATAAFDGGNLDEPLDGTAEIVASVAVDHAVPGRLVLNSSATLFSAGGLSAARCSITTGTDVDDNAEQVAYVEDGVGNAQRQTIAGTRGYAIAKSGIFPAPDERTYNLVCQGIGGNPVLRDAHLTAVFVSDPTVTGITVIPFP